MKLLSALTGHLKNDGLSHKLLSAVTGHLENDGLSHKIRRGSHVWKLFGVYLDDCVSDLGTRVE